MSEASQTFGRAAADYAAARPRYPAALYDWLAEIAPRRGNVWDCGTGNGQAAVDLARRFKAVYATDFSDGQIKAALPAANVTYAVEPAEHCSRPDGWADLITVANALHWFDFDSFWPEVKRVGRRAVTARHQNDAGLPPAADAVFVAWGYNWVRVSPDFDATVTTPFRDIIAPFWAPNNKLNWNGYRDADIKFPFQRIPHPDFTIEVEWSFRQILAFMQTWSAYRLCLKNAETAKAMADFLAHIETVHRPDEVFTARMPLVMVAGRI